MAVVVMDREQTLLKDSGELFLVVLSWTDWGLGAYQNCTKNTGTQELLVQMMLCLHTATPGTHVIFVEVLQSTFPLR